MLNLLTLTNDLQVYDEGENIAAKYGGESSPLLSGYAEVVSGPGEGGERVGVARADSSDAYNSVDAVAKRALQVVVVPG